MATSVRGVVPDPDDVADDDLRAAIRGARDYMDLAPGTAITDIRVDQVFIGSCTNGRLEDLRAAARVAERGRARVPALVVPGSGPVKREAEREGLDRIFRAAGFEWAEPGCSMCLGQNGDTVPARRAPKATASSNFRDLGWPRTAPSVPVSSCTSRLPRCQDPSNSNFGRGSSREARYTRILDYDFRRVICTEFRGHLLH